MADSGNPTVHQRALGARLRGVRLDRGLTVEAVADQMMCSTAKISRMETATRKPGVRDVQDLCRFYELDDAATAELVMLARGARERGWWAQYEGLNLNPYIGLEQDASAISAYCLLYLHGLVQTETYAREVVQATAPRLEPQIHRQRVEAQLRRQELLEREQSPRYRLLLDEAVLLRPIGGPAVMADQIAKILELSDAGKVTTQLIPLAAGAYQAADIGFTLLEFDEAGLSPGVFVEGLAANHYYERPADIDRYRDSIEMLRDCALSPRDSNQRMLAMQRAHATGQLLPT